MTYDLSQPHEIFHTLHVHVLHVTPWHLQCAWPVDTDEIKSDLQVDHESESKKKNSPVLAVL